MSRPGTAGWHRSLGVVRRSMRAEEIRLKDWARAAVVRPAPAGTPERVHPGCTIAQEEPGVLVVVSLADDSTVATYGQGTWRDAASYGADGYMLVAFSAADVKGGAA